MIEKLLKERNLTVYKASKLSGIPYTTLSDLVSEKTPLNKCSADTLYRLSKVLNMSMDEIMERYIDMKEDDFELFKSTIKHEIKSKGDLQFMIETMMNDDVRKYWAKKKYVHALYLVATLDYLARINDFPPLSDYAEFRTYKIEDLIWPRDLVIFKNDKYREDAISKSIPEFIRFNIVETDLRDAC